MEQARGYQPKTVEFPEHTAEVMQMRFEWIDEQAILQHLTASLPISDLMAWLVRHYADYQDVTLLGLYHKLIRLPDVSAIPDAAETRITLKQVAVRLHSHRVESL